MRYRKPLANRDALGQFFTPPEIASVLARKFKSSAGSLLELGAGEGALAAAMLERFPSSLATLVEIDPPLTRRLRRCYPGHNVLQGNVLTRIDRLPLAPMYDRVFGNPPFGEFAVTLRDQQALREQFPECDRGGWIRKDVAFLYESWRRVSPGGELAMLLASPLINDPTFADVRRWLLRDAGYAAAFELPETTFLGAEVGTYLLVIRHRGRGRHLRSVHVDKYLGESRWQGRISIPIDAAIQRMDFRFHSIRKAAGAGWESASSLETLGAQVIRGSRSHGQFVQTGVPHVHTTDLADGTARIRLGSHYENGVRLAKAGDILVPRVGSRCLLREALVMSGTRPITEAVYRVRVPRENRARVFDALSSDAGRLWRQAYARGSCAKHLTVSDLLRLPVHT